MRLAPLLLATSTLALLSSCSGARPHSKQKPPVLTGVTEYYHRGYKPSSSVSAAPLPVAPVKPSRWTRATSPRTTGTRTATPYTLGSIRGKGRVAPHVSSTRAPIFANSDGTTSRVVGNALIRSDGTRGDMIGNTVYHSNGTTSRIVGDTLINADGSHSPRINDNPQ